MLRNDSALLRLKERSQGIRKQPLRRHSTRRLAACRWTGGRAEEPAPEAAGRKSGRGRRAHGMPMQRDGQASADFKFPGFGLTAVKIYIYFF